MHLGIEEEIETSRAQWTQVAKDDVFSHTWRRRRGKVMASAFICTDDTLSSDPCRGLDPSNDECETKHTTGISKACAKRKS